MPEGDARETSGDGGVATARETLSVTDNRTGKTYELEVSNGTIRAMDLRGIKVDEDDFGLMSFDPAFTNTAACTSEITYIDGEAGVLEYRGYSIEDLCENASYLEVAYLLIHGELPTRDALDGRWILHADHEQNCSTNAVRGVGSSQVDPYSAVAAGVAALYGPLHGGANEAALKMLERIGTVENIPDFLEGVKNREEKLMGFGHRVYKNYDPRARIIKKNVEEVLEVMGTNPKLEIAVELEKRALDDEYFHERKLYPNVDFYSGLIYEALGLPYDMFTVMFAIPRTSGWVAQWLEMVEDKDTKIARPRQEYTGERERDWVPMDQR